jgi:hypothetical protein
MADGQQASAPSLRGAPVTPALANYMNDHYAMLKFEAYLWKMIVTVDYGRGTPKLLPPGETPAPDSAVGQMNLHAQYLGEMTFCRGVNSFQTYLAELLTMIFEARPETLKSQKKVTREFCVEHYTANDVISALAEQTVNELAYQGLNDLAEFFNDSLHLPLFTNTEDLEMTALRVDIRNIITHNRGVVNTFFVKRHPEFAHALGHAISFNDDNEVGEMLGTLLFFARNLDSRAVAKFGLKTLAPE